MRRDGASLALRHPLGRDLLFSLLNVWSGPDWSSRWSNRAAPVQPLYCPIEGPLRQSLVYSGEFTIYTEQSRGSTTKGEKVLQLTQINYVLLEHCIGFWCVGYPLVSVPNSSFVEMNKNPIINS